MQDVPVLLLPGILSKQDAEVLHDAGMSISVCWGDRDTGLGFAYFTNGLRRDKHAAIIRRDLSDAVRATWSGMAGRAGTERGGRNSA